MQNFGISKYVSILRNITLWTSPSYLAITPGVDVKGVWVEAVPELVTGRLKLWASIASVSSIRIPGYWQHKVGTTIEVAAPPMPGEKILYVLHGGAYVALSAHPSDVTASIARGFLKYCDSIHRVFSIEYRLSVGLPHKPAYPFPTALLDALAGYNYLVNVVGFSPSDIIIEGDSAGGNLAHALTRYLVDYQNTPDLNLPAPPSSLILLSPWSDLGSGRCTPGSSALTHKKSDFISVTEEASYAKMAFLGPHGIGAADINPYISPASLHLHMDAHFAGFPRTFIVGGGAEVLIDQIRTLKDRMIKDLGEGDGVLKGEGKVRYFEAADAVHDYLVLPWHEPERTETFQVLANWIAAV